MTPRNYNGTTLWHLVSPPFSSSERCLEVGSRVAEGAHEFSLILGDHCFNFRIVSSVVVGGERGLDEGGWSAGGGRRLLLEAITFVAWSSSWEFISIRVIIVTAGVGLWARGIGPETGITWASILGSTLPVMGHCSGPVAWEDTRPVVGGDTGPMIGGDTGPVSGSVTGPIAEVGTAPVVGGGTMLGISLIGDNAWIVGGGKDAGAGNNVGGGPVSSFSLYSPSLSYWVWVLSSSSSVLECCSSSGGNAMSNNACTPLPTSTCYLFSTSKSW